MKDDEHDLTPDSIEVGKIADIIAVDGNPIEKIEAMLTMAFIMKEGIVYKK